MMRVLILGCGYTGCRTAARLVAGGHTVFVTSRHPGELKIPGTTTVRLDELATLGPGLRVLHSVPLSSLPHDPTPELFELLPPGVERMVYLSTTGVYGPQREVNETTPPQPVSVQARLRTAAEQLVLAGPWTSMVLRPAAIYGPGRGAHVSIPGGRFRLLGDGSNFVSRIHVDDLAAISAKAIVSNHSGAWPAADLEPARSIDVARFVCELTGTPLPPSASAAELHETRRADRRVDGRALLSLFGLKLRYPSFRQGIPAAMAQA